MNHYLEFESINENLEVWRGEMLIASAESAVLLNEIGGFGYLPIYYFNKNDINLKLITKISYTSYCYLKGNADFWCLSNQMNSNTNSIWSYPNPLPKAEILRDLIAFAPQSFEIKRSK